MVMILRPIFLIFVLFAFSGCSGKNFVRPNSDTFKLGQTTYSQVVQQMGDPVRTGTVLRNGKQVNSITYVYAISGGDALEEGVIPARALAYYFHSDILVGHDFVSSFKPDNSNFDESKIGSIVKGQTTRLEVVQLMGKPTAAFIPPMVKQTSREAIGYAYTTTRGSVYTGFKVFRKALNISFDEKDVVSEIDYASSDNK
jgi:outer membrane protein assembly factor BamE (lipoprotein component of BamABCDE complex)